MVFQFKQFAVSHANSSMKVGTDAVLLASWADVKNCENILDIGTGSGIIALIMAQKNKSAIIKAIDIDENSIIEAARNFQLSRWQLRLEAILISLQEYSILSTKKFDGIISNPPFFSNSTPSPVIARQKARHTDTLWSEDFFRCSKKLLNNSGKIAIILPAVNSDYWLEIAGKNKLYPCRITRVFSYPGKHVERVMIEFSSIMQSLFPNELYIRKGKGMGYSDEYIELTKELYL